MPLKKIYTKAKTSLIKRQSLSKIAKADHRNKNIYSFYNVCPHNTGDKYCSPIHYFDEINDDPIHILNYKCFDNEVRNKHCKKIINNKLIVGGGGLLNRNAFSKPIKLIEELNATKNKKIVLWGLGHNEKDPASYGKKLAYNIDVENFEVAGTRDFSMPGEYVPCVSCLHPVFDKTYQVSQEIGIIFHRHTLDKTETTNKFKNIPASSNNANLEELIQFIGNSETIITDSYHGMYLSMLLGKKVVVVPNSSKFYDFKYDPIYSTFENAIEDTKKAENYSGILEECREINHNFAEKVFDYLNI